MRYAAELTIDLPRDQVIKLFDSIENLYQWQPGLKSHRVLRGEPGREGCRSKLVYEARKGELVMTETVTKRNFPEEYHAEYRSKGVVNEMYNYFTEPEKDQTRWQTVNLFRFRGLMALMAPFMKTAFYNNTVLNMERFKTFAENSRKNQ
ncbi:MAG: SRPBCC family protein [Bacteroidales bacterium]